MGWGYKIVVVDGQQERPCFLNCWIYILSLTALSVVGASMNFKKRAPLF